MLKTILENHLSHLSQERQLALHQLFKVGFPTKRDEEWKYTSLNPVLDHNYSLSPNEHHSLTIDSLSSFLIEGDFARVVFVNGKFCEKLSDTAGLNFSPISEKSSDYIGKLATSTAFTHLNDALYRDCFYLDVQTESARPIHLLYISQGQNEPVIYNPRNLLLVRANATVEIVESHHNLDSGVVLTNSITEIFVEDNAEVHWDKLQNDSSSSYLIDQTWVHQGRDSRATVNTLSFGGKLVRNNLDFIQEGENINSFMNGITVISDEQLVDHHTAVHHNQPNCESYQNYKGIFDGKSRGVFNGKVFVDKIAQKTNAYQQNNNVLLSEGASIDTKPQLEIFADDVKCSHGCTVGQLNADALFYLRARGISKEKAQALLLYAFANDALENIRIDALRTRVSNLLANKLGVSIEF